MKNKEHTRTVGSVPNGCPDEIIKRIAQPFVEEELRKAWENITDQQEEPQGAAKEEINQANNK